MTNEEAIRIANQIVGAGTVVKSVAWQQRAMTHNLYRYEIVVQVPVNGTNDTQDFTLAFEADDLRLEVTQT